MDNEILLISLKIFEKYPQNLQKLSRLPIKEACLVLKSLTFYPSVITSTISIPE